MEQRRDTPMRLTTTGEVLRTLRTRAGLSRDVTAHRAGLASGTLSRYESDEPVRPDVSSVRAVLDVLAQELGRPPEEVWRDYRDWLLSENLVDRIAADLYLAGQVRAVLGD